MATVKDYKPLDGSWNFTQAVEWPVKKGAGLPSLCEEPRSPKQLVELHTSREVAREKGFTDYEVSVNFKLLYLSAQMN